MISYLISYFFGNIRIAQERLSYDIIHDIIVLCTISYMISYMILAWKTMISWMISYNLWFYDIIHETYGFVVYDIIYDNIHSIMMSCIVFIHFSCLAAADRHPAQRADASDDGSTRWTSRWDAAAGAAPWWCLSPRRRGSGPNDSARAGPGRQRRGSVAAWPLPQRGWRKAAVERIEHWPMIS